jgi:acetyltransferase-like isoleucine patch superfamily enzyme
VKQMERVFTDVISVVILLIPLYFAALLSLYLGRTIIAHEALVPAFFVPFFLLFLMIISRCAMSFLPSLESGTFVFPVDKVARAWGLTFLIKRPLQWNWMREICHSTSLLRTFYYWCLGSKVPWNVTFASGAEIRDPALFECGEKVSLGAGCIISAHLLSYNKLELGKVKMGDGVHVGGHCVVGPGSTFGNRVFVGFGTFIGRNVTLEDDVIVGGHCHLSDGVHLKRGAFVRDHTHVPKNACLAENEVLGLIERWKPNC